MSGGRRWTVRLSEAAARDLRGIATWTAARFGAAQAEIYGETLAATIDELQAGPRAAGARPRSDILPTAFTLHVRRKRRKGRHLFLFLADEADRNIEVLRILHDSMDLARHVPDVGPDDL